MGDFSKNVTREFIEALCLSKDYGYITSKEILDWAENLIEADFTEQILFDISEAGGQSEMEMRYVMNCYVGDRKPEYASRIILSFLSTPVLKGQIDEQAAAEKLYKIGLSQLELPYIDKALCRWFEHNYDLAKNGFILGFEELKKSIKIFIRIFSAYKLDNYPEWGRIHEEVNEQVFSFLCETQSILRQRNRVRIIPP